MTFCGVSSISCSLISGRRSRMRVPGISSLVLRVRCVSFHSKGWFPAGPRAALLCQILTVGYSLLDPPGWTQSRCRGRRQLIHQHRNADVQASKGNVSPAHPAKAYSVLCLPTPPDAGEQVQDDDVCEGSIAREGPIAARALRGMTPGSRTSRLFCVASMGYCSYPEVDVDELSFPSPKPPSRVPGGGHSRPPPSGRKPLRVVHYSDIHVDPWYVAGANANCSKPICCR